MIPEIVLTIPLTEKTKKPENDALKHYRINGWDGVNDEGEMLFLLLKAACFINLPETAYKLSNDKVDNKNYFGVYHRRITEQLRLSPEKRYWPFSEWGTVDDRVSDIKNITEETVVRNFNLIKDNTYCRGVKRDHSSFYYLYYENYSDAQIKNAYRALGNNALAEILEITCGKYGDGVRHDVGWPDLMMWKENKVIFREVKTKNDTIRKNQVGVYKTVFDDSNFDYKIIRLLYE